MNQNTFQATKSLKKNILGDAQLLNDQWEDEIGLNLKNFI